MTHSEKAIYLVCDALITVGTVFPNNLCYSYNYFSWWL